MAEMEFTWQNHFGKKSTVKRILTEHGVSHRMLARLKHGQGNVRLNGKKTVLSNTVEPNEEVTLVLPPEKADERILVSHEKIRIVYEDENWLVLDKPAGISSVPGPSNKCDTMMNRIKGYLIEQGSDNLVPHAVTRLDRFTSGLMLCAKHGFAQGLISKQVQEHSMEKRYLAFCSGFVRKNHGIIDLPLKKEDDGFRRIVSRDGQNAVTEFWVREHFGNEATLVECMLHTGRTHQIRAHFAHVGHPLISDELYGGRENGACKRQALHACYLAFDDPFSCKRLSFELPLEKDMEYLLGELRGANCN
ncbi:RluA family pseudouridine synthase [Ligilactobacillus sp.]|uniref:RluA family pseudouridine synthase n=1 Tax=Ligilactobacillus sp. TaxID=2767921 RepID=UPI002FE25B10